MVQTGLWWTYSAERYERLERTRGVQVYGSVDPCCALPTLRAQPCRPSASGPRWFVYCASCQWQAMLRTASEAYALFGLGEILRASSHERRAAVAARFFGAGRGYLDTQKWQRVELAGVERQIASGHLTGCPWCGERNSVEWRKDKYGRPYPHCCACLVRVFPRIQVSQALHAGLSLALRDGTIGWSEIWDRGQALWSAWTPVACTGAEVHPTAEVEHAGHLQQAE